MAAYVASNGETITSTGSEQEIYLNGFAGQINTEVIVNLELQTGSVQFAVGESVVGKHRTYSTAGDKAIRTVACNPNRSLRCLGAGTFTIAW